MLFWENQKVVSSFYTQSVKPVCEQYQLTKMEFDILMFLTNNPEYDTASDIVKIRMLTKSHVSAAIKELEMRGLIQTFHKSGNKKTVHISILGNAAPIIKDGKKAQEAFGQKLFQGFSDEELKMCRDLFQRMYANARTGIKEVQI